MADIRSQHFGVNVTNDRDITNGAGDLPVLSCCAGDRVCLVTHILLKDTHIRRETFKMKCLTFFTDNF